jgi:hypothetical protein
MALKRRYKISLEILEMRLSGLKIEILDLIIKAKNQNLNF